MLDSLKRYARRRLAPAIEQRVAADLTLASRIVPADAKAANLVTPLGAGAADVRTPAEFPLPPTELRAGIPEYLALGEVHVDNLRASVRAAGVTEVGNVLDFGCGTGRMTRWLLDESRASEVWGADFNADCILWNQVHLSPPFHFVTCSSLPSLPFEDGYFGLTLAGSVFTHISELADAWLLELRRVTRPGGLLYLTIQDGPFIDRVTADHPELWISRLIEEHRGTLDLLGRTAESVAIGRQGNDAMVFHDRDALVRRWSVHLDVVDVVDDAFYAQTAIVLRKRLPGGGDRPRSTGRAVDPPQ